jgi:predicted 2-oxoglutarate/Fe(II)-dependent dioxygenase YbiX
MTRPAASTHDPASLDLRDHICILDDAFPSSLSRTLLERYGQDAGWEPATVDVATAAASVRNCDIRRIVDVAQPATDAADRALEVELSQLVGSWTATYLERVGPIGLSSHTGIGLIRYRVGGFYRMHFDEHPDQRRIVTAIAIVHHDHAGGELEFFGGQHRVAAQPGQVVLFPSAFLFSHAVLPVTAGIRYSVITWLR